MPAQSLTVKMVKADLLKNGPSHYKALADRLIAEKKIEPRGKDPQYTVYADCFFAVKNGDEDLRMAGRGVFALKSHGDVDPSLHTPERIVNRVPKFSTIEEIDAEISRLKELKKTIATPVG